MLHCLCALLPLPVVGTHCVSCLYCMCMFVCVCVSACLRVLCVWNARKLRLCARQRVAVCWAHSNEQLVPALSLLLLRTTAHSHIHIHREAHTHIYIQEHTHTCREGARDTYSLTCCWPCVRFMMLCVCACLSVCVSKYLSVCICVRCCLPSLCVACGSIMAPGIKAGFYASPRIPSCHSCLICANRDIAAAQWLLRWAPMESECQTAVLRAACATIEYVFAATFGSK